MAQTTKFQGVARHIVNDGNGNIDFYYHDTRIVAVQMINMYDRQVTLDSGRWRTVTTKLAMNQASNEFNLGFGVYQRDYDWFVTLPDGEIIPFKDCMTFAIKSD